MSELFDTVDKYLSYSPHLCFRSARKDTYSRVPYRATACDAPLTFRKNSDGYLAPHCEESMIFNGVELIPESLLNLSSDVNYSLYPKENFQNIFNESLDALSEIIKALENDIPKEEDNIALRLNLSQIFRNMKVTAHSSLLELDSRELLMTFKDLHKEMGLAKLRMLLSEKWG